MGFPYTLVGKESACDAGDPGSIPGLGRSPGEGIGYPLQYSWASLVAQTLKNPPATWETWVRSLCWEDPLEKKGMATHSSILAWRIQSMGLERVDQATFTFSLHRIPQHKWLLQTRKQRQGEGAQCSRGLPQASASVAEAIPSLVPPGCRWPQALC